MGANHGKIVHIPRRTDYSGDMKPRIGFATAIGLMLAVAACGSGSEPAGTASSAPPVQETPSAPSGPAAPAVSLQLDDGSSFNSSQAVRPTLYVFWAEW